MPTQSTDTDWQNLHGTGLFLSCFRKPAALQEVAEAVDWPPLLHCEPELAAERLIAQGLLEPVEGADQEPPLLRCTKRGEIRSRLYLEDGAPHLAEQEDLRHASWSEAVLWLITALGAAILGNEADDILTTLAEELLEPAPSQTPPSEPSTRLLIEPELVRVPAGSFLMGTSDRQIRWLKTHFDWAQYIDFSREQPQHTVTLSAFEIGRYLVTNAEFKSFMDDGGYQTRSYWTAAGWAFVKRQDAKQPAYWDDEKYCAPAQPVVGISWYEAVAFCTWLRKKTGRPYRLPTEAEWEKAARGTDRRIYPWGNRWDPARCNSAEGGKDRPTPVGMYSPAGDSPYGCADMAGNVSEWCQSLYKHYPYDPNDGRERLGDPGARVWRGGAFDGDVWYQRCGCRWMLDEDVWNPTKGFRCVVAPG